jgi:hypothetical protein
VLSIVNTRDPASREHAFMLEAKFVYIQGSTVMGCRLGLSVEVSVTGEKF